MGKLKSAFNTTSHVAICYLGMRLIQKGRPVEGAAVIGSYHSYQWSGYAKKRDRIVRDLREGSIGIGLALLHALVEEVLTEKEE